MSHSWSARVERWLGRPSTVTAAAALALTVAIALQITRDRAHALEPGPEPTLSIRSGEVLGRMALSFDAVLADVYWMRALQEYGGTRRSTDPAKRYDALYPLLDITTTLDPRFNIAYRFGAIFLAEAYPNGPGRPDLAIALLQKGAAAMPDRWQYLMDIGFVHYWWLQDYRQAAAWFERAAILPGAPWWLQPLAANTLAEGGHRGGARLLWAQLLESADDDWMQAEAARRLLQLDALDELDRLTEAARRFASETGRWPRTWGDLDLDVAPVDGAGYPYHLDTGSRGVRLSSESPLHPLPDTPRDPRS